MIKINVIVSNNAWKKYLKNPEMYLKKRIKKIESKYRLFKKKKLFFSIMLSGNEKIKKLNKQFRNKNNIGKIKKFMKIKLNGWKLKTVKRPSIKGNKKIKKNLLVKNFKIILPYRL